MPVRHGRHGITVAVTALALLGIPAPAGAATVSDPIVDGLAGPLGLAVGDDGTIYIAEAFAGVLTAVDHAGNTTTLVDLAGNEIAGVDSAGKGTTVYTSTLFDGEPGEESPPLDSSLSRVLPNGRTSTILSAQDFEETNNPDSVNTYGFTGASQECLASLPEDFGPTSYSGIIESHPYAVAIVDDGYVIADAAANALIHVGKNRRARTLAILPPVENPVTQEVVDGFGLPDCLVGSTYWGEPVPTDVEVAPNGDLLVSSLPGGPELPGTGSVWRLDPATGSLSLEATGLTGAVDLAVAADGTIYVAELFANQISQVASGVVTPYVSIPMPGAVEIGPDGSMYATSGVFGPGSLVRIQA